MEPAAVTEYAVTARLFMMCTVLVAMAVIPLWPAFTDALEQGHREWAKTAFRRATWLAFLASLSMAVVLVLLGRPLVRIWIDPDAEPSLGLLVALGCWVVIMATLQPTAMLLNAAGVVKVQVIVATTMAVANLALSIVFTNWFGIVGPVVGSIVAYSVCTVVPLWLYVRHRFSWSIDSSAKVRSA
jgi:O-antigen/teichoic acid export membrane protein